MKKTLVAYFSASGTTRKVAEMIAEAGDCALYELSLIHISEPTRP